VKFCLWKRWGGDQNPPRNARTECSKPRRMTCFVPYGRGLRPLRPRSLSHVLPLSMTMKLGSDVTAHLQTWLLVSVSVSSTQFSLCMEDSDPPSVSHLQRQHFTLVFLCCSHSRVFVSFSGESSFPYHLRLACIFFGILHDVSNRSSGAGGRIPLN